MNKPHKPNVQIPSSFALNGQKTDFTETKIQNGFNPIDPDVLAGDNLNKFIDDTYKSINYTNAGVEDLYKSLITYDPNETYNLNSLVFFIDNNNKISLYKSKSDNNTEPLSDTDYWEEVELGSGGRNVGEIITSSLPLTDAGLHLLDGTLINGGGIYAEFVDYIAELYADNPTANCFCTETEWQNSVTTYGSCGKFVYDSTNNTVRLPKVSDILQGTTDLSALGDLVVSGLPQHTHTRGTMEIYGYLGDVISSISSGASGAFNWWNTGAVTGIDNQQQPLMASDFYASRNWTGSTSNANYTSTIDTTSKVQPQTIKTLLYIVIATSSKTDIQVDIDNIATDLNGKAGVDLSNLSTTGQSILDNKANISLSNVDNNAKILMSGMGMPSNKYINLTLGASGTKYTAPSDGYIQLVKEATGVNQYICISLAGLYTGVGNSDCLTYSQSVANQILAIYAPVRKGEQFYIYYSAVGTVFTFKFIYAVGSGSEVQ